MTLTQLEYLIAVDTHRHFGRAAEACNISQPTLSMQVRKLEGQLGIEIFDRTHTPVRPTDLGSRIVAQARRVVRERDRILGLLPQPQEELSGDFRLGVIPTVSPYLLPLVTPVFAQKHAAVEVSVHEMTTETILTNLAEDRIDAGIIATDESRPGLRSRPLYRERFVGYVSADHPLASRESLRPRDLSRSELWLLSEGHCLRDQVLNLCEQGAEVEFRTRFDSGSLETLRNLVDRVGGMTLLPELATQYLTEMARRKVRRFESPAPWREVRIVHRNAYAIRSIVDAYAYIAVATVGTYID